MKNSMFTALIACGLAFGVNLSEAGEFEDFLQVKRIGASNPEILQVLQERFSQQVKLADAIEQQNVLDSGLINAEVNMYRKQLLIERYFERYLQQVVTNESVEQYYKNNPSEFQKEKVRVAHILVLQEKAKASSPEAEKSGGRPPAVGGRTPPLSADQIKIQKIHEQLKLGQSFEVLAREHSQDRLSALRGGDLGWLARDALEETFSQRVFSMKVGEISEPFATAKGFHIAKIIEGPRNVTQSFEAVSSDIRQTLREEFRKKEMERLLTVEAGGQ